MSKMLGRRDDLPDRSGAITAYPVRIAYQYYKVAGQERLVNSLSYSK
jgi:hypothetical protein